MNSPQKNSALFPSTTSQLNPSLKQDMSEDPQREFLEHVRAAASAIVAPEFHMESATSPSGRLNRFLNRAPIDDQFWPELIPCFGVIEQALHQLGKAKLTRWTRRNPRVQLLRDFLHLIRDEFAVEA